MDLKEAVKIILEKYSDSNIMSAFKLPSGYLFSLKPKSWGKDKEVFDGLFKVSDDGKISEYSPGMNLEEFKEAINNNRVL